MLNRKQYFIREHAGLLKLSDVYDILDPESKAKIGEAREKWFDDKGKTMPADERTKLDENRKQQKYLVKTEEAFRKAWNALPK